jgi:glycogen debranching enzyme
MFFRLLLQVLCACGILCTGINCQLVAPADPIAVTLAGLVADAESIEGTTEYITSPYVTAGDRLYMVGAQDGSFPDLGWHVTGEMGGIWNHPIKLLDGFTERLQIGADRICLPPASRFVNYPFANQHIYPAMSSGLQVRRTQFVPDATEGILIEYLFENPTAEAINFTFEFNGYADLRPVWLGERTGMEDAPDLVRFDQSTGLLIAQDSLNPWFAVFGAFETPTGHTIHAETCDYSPVGQGRAAAMEYELRVEAGQTQVLHFAVTGSDSSPEEAMTTYERIRDNWPQLVQEKQNRYQQIADQSKLTIPDKELETAYRWLKYNTDWLVRDVEGIGRGICAGIPDYPWWFGVDSEYALQGVIGIGQQDLVYSTIELLTRISQETNGNGRIVHEVSTNGAVFNPGNINETPQFAILIWAIYQWTGDEELLTEYFPVIRDGLEWLLAENDADNNLLADGFGMMEIHGLNSEMIDVAAYSQKAFEVAALMAEELGEVDLAASYRANSDQLIEQINTEFWVEEFQSYADFIGTAEEAIHLIDDAIVRADTLGKPWAVAELKATRAKISQLPPAQKQGFVVHHNWVVNTPMEMGIAEPDKALIALETGSRFVNPFGMFVTGIDRDESAGQDVSSFAEDMKVFSYTGAVMTLPTGVQAIGENNYGRPDQALDYLQRMTRTFSFALPGSMYEVSPDFGMMTQAWNIYSFAVPIIQQFFGLQPAAAHQTIVLRPQMPSTWESASLEEVLVGANRISINYVRSAAGMEVVVTQSNPDWTVVLEQPENTFQAWEVNQEVQIPTTVEGAVRVSASGAEIHFELR